MRIMITGSRDWGYLRDGARLIALPESDEWKMIAHALDALKAENQDVRIVHGECPTGADAIADMWAQHNVLFIERFPADWGRYGRSAGPRRNKAMVETDPDLVLAFCKNGSAGTNGTVRMAAEHGLPVVKWDRQSDGATAVSTFNIPEDRRIGLVDALWWTPSWSEKQERRSALMDWP